jgi:hypothetical protein
MKSLIFALSALAVSACGAAPAPTVTVTAPAPTVTVQAPEPAPAPDLSSDGETIRDLLATQGFDYSGPASDLDEVANSVCEAIDSGISPEMLVEVAMNSGFSMREGAAIVAAAIVVKCPWNEGAV